MISFKSSMQVAHTVLSVVNTLLDNSDDDTSRLPDRWSTLQREQGYHIAGWSSGMTNSLGISFSENRNSDAIVVYVGENKNFSMQGNAPDEETYHKSTHFGYGEYQKAAEFIVEKIREMLAKGVKSPPYTASDCR